MNKTVVIASDHAGFELKQNIIETVEEAGCKVIDVGAFSKESSDFPDFVQLGAEKIKSGKADAGIFLCGSGVGVCIAANKIPGIYASVCHDTYSAHQGVEHDGMNVLCLGARIIGPELANELVKAFLGAAFNNKPNQIRRFNKIKQIEAGDLYLINRIEALRDIGQSVWLDQANRCQLKNGELVKMIEKGQVSGLIMNSGNMCSAILNSDDYASALVPMMLAGWNCRKIFDKLLVDDVRSAAGIFKDLYISSGGKEGYVTLTLDPELSHNIEKTVSETKRIWTAVNRPNILIGIPATEEGLEAAKQLVTEGININFTMIVSEKSYSGAVDAYLSGLETRLKEGKPIDKIYSTASVDVAEIDHIVNKFLDQAVDPVDPDKSTATRGLKMKAALIICRRIFNLFLETNQSGRMQNLIAEGAEIQHLLWSSLCHKEPSFKDTYYTDSLIAENTILSVHPKLMDAVIDHGQIIPSLRVPHEEDNQIIEEFEKLGIHFESLTERVQEEIMESYKSAFESMLKELDKKSDRVKKSLGCLYTPVFENFKKLEEDSIIQRIFAKDPTVWTFDTQAYPEIRNRLGWLDAHQNIAKSIDEYKSIAAGLKKDGIHKILLMGMGGSSLAPEVMALTFKNNDGMALEIIDSTDPVQVLAADASHPPKETVYIVSSKSGGTAEVQAFLDYFFERAKTELADQAGSHFIAITDPGTQLERKAKEMGFRNIILADPSIGGRFSALSAFGVFPAVLMGINPETIIEQATRMAKICAPSNSVGCNEGAALGVYMGTAALNGRDKFTILTDPEFSAFGSWLEQLIAESTGKMGKGIVPIDIEPKLAPSEYAEDRAFVYVETSGTQTDFVNELIAAGQPVLTIKLNDLNELFAEFYRWEIAVAVACSLLGVNAFDQPNVQDSKNRTVAKITEYKEKGQLTDFPACWEKDGLSVYFNTDIPDLKQADDIKHLIKAFIRQAIKGKDYIAINAYLPRNEKMAADLQNVRAWILKETQCATTLGFGPRFQHSTGQLHKGGANNGLFIQLIADAPQDIEIPNEGITFSILEKAQALGDFEALLAKERRAIRINLGSKAVTDLL